MTATWYDSAAAAEQGAIDRAELNGWLQVRYSDGLGLEPVNEGGTRWWVTTTYSETRDQYRASVQRRHA